MAKMLKLTEKVSPILEDEGQKREQFTLQDFINKQGEFLVYKRSQNLAPRTMYDYQKNFQWINSYISDTYTDLSDRYCITLIRSYISYMLENVASTTVNIRLRTIKVYLQYLEDERYVAERINYRIKKVKEIQKEKQPLTSSDVKKLLKAIDLKTYAGLRDYAMALVMLSVGVRINEMCHIKVKDVNLKEKCIVIRGENAKSRKQRIVPINSKIIVYLKKLIEIAENVDNEYMFLSSTTHDKVSTSNVKNRFINYGKKVNLDKSSSVHKLRHTAITNMVKNGVNPLDVKSIVGHNSLEMTILYYHNSLQELHKAIQKDTLYDL
jgi:integrase/recombinase XerD